MRMRIVRLIVAALGAMVMVAPAFAQEWQIGGFNLEGGVTAGVRGFVEEPSKREKAKFEEYRDIPRGPFLDRLRLRFFKPDESYSIEILGSKWLQEDQEYGLNVGRLGLWDFSFEWDQTPHILSTTARTLERRQDERNWTLPVPRPALNASTWNNAPFLDPIGVRWDTARIGLRLTPTPNLDIAAEYTRIRKEGDKPFGVAFGSPGNQFVEIPRPIDQTVDDFRLKATYARDTWQIQAGYTLSVFRNDDRFVRADSPFAATWGAFSDGSSVPAAGQVSLEPDNIAHTFTLSGGVNLPLRTRVTANFSYSLALQDQKFLPHTINPNILAEPDASVLALPQNSLNGLVNKILFNVNATSRPIAPLTLVLKYRLFRYDDDSDSPVFPGNVESDRTLRDEFEKAVRPNFTRQNVDADARFALARPLALTVGGGWERWDRDLREVKQSDEVFAKAAVDANLLDWLTARLTYRPSVRFVGKYDPFARQRAEALGVLEEATDIGQGQSQLLRKPDESDRTRQRVDLLLTASPLDTMSTSLNASWHDDDYPHSPLGLKKETGWSAGFDLNWSPVQIVTFTAGYVHEVFWQKMRSQYRGVPVEDEPATNNASDTWISDIQDTTDTAFLGVSFALIPKVLDWNFAGDYSFATGDILTRNPLGPVAQASAQANRLPATDAEIFRLGTALRYHFWKVWTVSVGYTFESFAKNDWRTDQLQPLSFGPTGALLTNGVFLGNDLKNYTAHIVGATLGYRFK